MFSTASLLLTAAVVSVTCVEISKEAREYCTTLLDKYDTDYSIPSLQGIIEPGVCCNVDEFAPADFFLPKVLIWCPLTKFKIQLKCPEHNYPLRIGPWKITQTVNGDPRLLLDVNGNVLLLSRYYVCSEKSAYHRILSCDVRLIQQYPDFIEIPFSIGHRSSYTIRYLTFLMVQISHGVNFNEIAESLAQLNFEDFCRRKRQLLNMCAQNNLQTPIKYMDNSGFQTDPQYNHATDSFLRDIFLRHFKQLKALYEDDMSTLSASSVSMDHTFKICKNVGAARASDGKWVTQYGSLFAVINERGEIVKWLLCSGEGFEEIRMVLCEFRDRLQQQGNHLTHIMVDICCKWRAKLQEVFGTGLCVKLDLFHAVQRFTSKLGKHCKYREDCINEFSLVFRQPCDRGKVRKEATAPSGQIMKQMETFITKWGPSSDLQIIQDEALKELENLKYHVQKGCLSDIPVGHGTQRNEGLHRLLNRSLVTGACRIGVELAFALLTVLFYLANSKVRRKEMQSFVPLAFAEYSNKKFPSRHKGNPEHFGLIPPNHKLTDTLLNATSSDQQSFEKPPCQYQIDKSLIKDLFREDVIIPMALNLYELLSNISDSCVTRCTNAWDFPCFVAENVTCLLGGRFEAATSDEEIDHIRRIEERLHGFSLELEQVEKDGNCAFTSIACQVSRLFDKDINSEFLDHLISLELDSIKPVKSMAKTLRQLFVHELISNRGEYIPQTYNMTETEFNEEARGFETDGVFSNQLGDFVMRAISNVLGCAVIVITSMDNYEIIPFIPQRIRCKEPLYVAYNSYGPGHYDSTMENAVKKADKDRPQSFQFSASKNILKCRCGRDRVKNDPGYVACSNVGRIGKYSTRCPCNKSRQGCSYKCRCINCNNEHGKKLLCSGVETSGKGFRKRYVLCSNKRKRSEDFMKDLDLTVKQGGWTSLETCVFEVILQLVSGTSVDQTPENVLIIYDHVAKSQSVDELGLSLRPKTLHQIRGKWNYREQRSNLSAKFAAKQLRSKLSEISSDLKS